MALSQDVKALRKVNNVDEDWPEVAVIPHRQPRHVYQKVLETLHKINLYRTYVAKIGKITIPRFPGREITPNEVYVIVSRLRQEFAFLNKTYTRHKATDHNVIKHTVYWTPSDVYAALSEISSALEQTLGLRGISPSDVYSRSQQVVDLAVFLRKSQHLSKLTKKPPRTSGKLPNHALKAVSHLLQTIHDSEKNLWMKPVTVPPIPKRVISPSEVYDSLGVAMAELQSIQYRLGLERHFAPPVDSHNKSSDDAIQNLMWAADILPSFQLDRALHQYNQSTLLKNYNHIFSVSQHTLKRLNRYRQLRGIQVIPQVAHKVDGLTVKNVYAKSLEVIEKLSILRHNQNLSAIAIPEYSMTKVTPVEVFELVLRIDSEFALIHEQEESAQLWSEANSVQEYENKGAGDVYRSMQNISNLLDVILGTKSVTENGLYHELSTAKSDVQRIASYLGNEIPEAIWKKSALKIDASMHDVWLQMQNVLNAITAIKQRAGIYSLQHIGRPLKGVATAQDVFNYAHLAKTELAEIKLFFDVLQNDQLATETNGKTVPELLQLAENLELALTYLLYNGAKP